METNKPGTVSTTNQVLISAKRLAELEFIEKNLNAIIKAAVIESCPDCRAKCCTVQHNVLENSGIKK
jgi:hypothetical protein